MRLWALVLVLLVGVCMAEPHVVDDDEWNTTVSDLVDGNDPRQHPGSPSLIDPASSWFVWGVVGVTGLTGLVFVVWRLRRAKR
jgi:hypothetical protein